LRHHFFIRNISNGITKAHWGGRKMMGPQNNEPMDLTKSQINLQLREQIAELMAENERLANLDREKTALIADLVHDLRGVITSLNLRLYMFERSAKEGRLVYLGEMKESVGAVAKLAENLLSAARQSVREMLPSGNKKQLH
jgi:signal transduction histidine kinase